MGNGVDSLYTQKFNRSLPSKYQNSMNITWRRIPSEINGTKTHYFNSDLCICDLTQTNNFGNCYYISALHSIILYYVHTRPENILNFYKQIGIWQGLCGKKHYTGKIKIKLYNGFSMVDVYIDDYLPFLNDKNQPLFSYNDHNEFWPMLLEKAILTFTNRSYSDADDGGIPFQIFSLLFPNGNTKILANPTVQECIGFLSSSSSSSSKRRDYFLTGAVIIKRLNTTKPYESILETGIVTNHAYCIFKYDANNIIIVNPWKNTEPEILQIKHNINRNIVRCSLCNSVSLNKKTSDDDGIWHTTYRDLPYTFNTFFKYTFTPLNSIIYHKTAELTNNISLTAASPPLVYILMIHFLDTNIEESSEDDAMSSQECLVYIYDSYHTQPYFFSFTRSNYNTHVFTLHHSTITKVCLECNYNYVADVFPLV